MKFKPTHDRVLIKPTPRDQFIADNFELLDGDQQDKSEGTVVAVGDGVPLHDIRLQVTGELTEASMNSLKEVIALIERGRQMRVQPGDYVQYGRYAGTKVMYEGEEHIMIREADIFGKFLSDE